MRVGTLFLDEIMSCRPRSGQDAPVLRTRRSSGSAEEDITVDLRIVTATNRTIVDEIKNGRFREDLFYRIGVVTIQLPPLRERKEDITILGTLFLMRFGEEFKKRIKGFSAAALELMASYSWPGNVRELENKIQRAVILSEGPLIGPHDLGFSTGPAAPAVTMPGSTTLRDARERIERQLVIQAMDRRKGNIAQAAEDLGISRPTFYDIMKKHGLFHMTNQHQRAV
jgi:two-component system NtrC family response regulator